MAFKEYILVVLAVVTFLSGCTLLNDVVYRPVVNQGNYITQSQIDKLQLGQSKEQVTYIMGSPMLHSIFSGNIWYYVFREHFVRGRLIQKTYTLTFDEQNRLIDITKKEKDDYHIK